MKILEQDKAEELLHIIQNKAGQRIIHFSDGSHILTRSLSKWCKKHHSHYYLYCTKGAFYDKSVTKYANQPHMHIVKFNLSHPKHIIQHINYDYLIATVDFTQQDKAVFLEKCYSVIGRAGGSLIILIPNSSYAQREEWRDILTGQYYVSINIIDDLFGEYDVIVSKRMQTEEISSNLMAPAKP